MPNWTTQATVKKHLLLKENSPENIYNEFLILSGETADYLRFKSVSSVEVQTIEMLEPYADSGKTLNGTTWASLQERRIVPGSVVIASSTVLGTVYIEGLDYNIDYDLGKIRRTSTGSIGNGATVYPFYLYYALQTEDTDYTLDSDAGTVARINGGGITDLQEVFVSYETSAGVVADDLIDQAILEAEDIILQRLSSDYGVGSSDQGLKTGATYLALSIISRDYANHAALQDNSDNVDGVMISWQKLAEKYELEAWEVLSRFCATRARSSTIAKKSDGSGD